MIVEPATASFDLGGSADIEVTVTNNTAEDLIGMMVHIDITNPDRPGLVDPEDWTAILTKPVGAVAPGTSITIPWTLKPISGGRFTIYAVVLRGGSSEIHASSGAIFDIAEQRTLNPRGVLSIALGMPILIGFILAGRWRFRKRRTAG